MKAEIDVETIADFLGIDDPERAEKSVRALVKSGKLAAARLSTPMRGEAANAMFSAARGLLESPLGAIFSQAWTTAHELRKYCDQAAYPPGSTAEHTLHKHEISLTRHPEIEALVDGAPTGVRLQFELKLAMNIDSAVLVIRDGRIMRARIGDFSGSGSYACGKITLAERKTSKFRLPGSLVLGDGIPLGALKNAPA
jgi:hypothetical protein